MRSAHDHQRADQRAALTDDLAEICQLAVMAMEGATQSLLQADLFLAERVIGSHETITDACARAEEAGFELLASQPPGGRDPRAVLSCIQILADLERMGVLALHVAQIARRRHPCRVLPDDVTGHFTQMGRIAVALGVSAHRVIVSCDLRRARHIREADDAMDDLHRDLFGVVLDREWKHGTTAAVDVTLLSRYYERFADHAVEICRRVIFQATGQVPAPERVPIAERTVRSAGLSRSSAG